jgi:thioredoxin 1
MEFAVKNDNFQKEVVESELPVLVYFYASWCEICKTMDPIIAELSEKYENRLKVGKCDIDEEMMLAGSHHVTVVPTMFIFVDGKETDTFTGKVEKEVLVETLEKTLTAFKDYVWEKFENTLDRRRNDHH